MSEKKKAPPTIKEGDKVRLPPVDVALELKALQFICMHKEKGYDLLTDSDLTSECFTENNYKDAFLAFVALKQEKAELNSITLRSKMIQLGSKIEVVDKIIADIGTDVARRLSDGESISKELSGLTHLRLIARIAAQIHETALNREQTASQLAKELEQQLQLLQIDASVGTTQILQAVYDSLSEFDATPSGLRLNGYSTGFYALDFLMNGLVGKELTVLAARPAMGKSAIAMNILSNLSLREQVPSLMFSMEMGIKELVMRILSSEALVNGDKFKMSAMLNIESDEYRRSHQSLMDVGLYLNKVGNIWIDDTNNLDIATIISKTRRLHRKLNGNLGCVVIDYLQLINSYRQSKSGYENRNAEIGKMTRDIKNLAKELDIPIILISQLSREVEKRNSKRPIISDLRDSGEIEQHADNVLFIHRPEYFQTDEEEEEQPIEDVNKKGKGSKSQLKQKKPQGGLAEVILAKHRNGSVGTIHLAWIKQFIRFASLSQIRKGY